MKIAPTTSAPATQIAPTTSAPAAQPTTDIPGYSVVIGRSNNSMTANMTDEEADFLVYGNPTEPTLLDCANLCNSKPDCKAIYRYRNNNKWGCDLKTSAETNIGVGPNQKFYIKQ
jgi:hypothetical protein